MIREYKNGNVCVRLDLSDGTKERYTEDNEFRPRFAESMDCTITYQCDGDCTFCYAGCSKKGRHANLESDYVVNTFIPSLEPYTELALNGNDLSHPQLKGFLEKLREREVVANITVNQKHFLKNKDLLHEWVDNGLIYGLGISLVDPKEEGFLGGVREFPNAVIHTIAGVLLPSDIEEMQGKDIKLLILGYKTKGRGVKYYHEHKSTIMKNIAILHNLLPGMIQKKLFNVISFDNLALEQLKVKKLINPDKWEEIYMGDEGTFTFFVDLVRSEFSLSSLSEKTYSISGMDTKEMFNCLR